MTQSTDTTVPRQVECPARREPHVKNVILAVAVLGLAAWCYTDRREAPADWSLQNINKVAAYVMNNWGPFVLAPLGALILIRAGLGLRKILIADDKGIGFAGRAAIPWEQVQSLDARRLQSKGIVVLRTAGRTLKLDSYYLHNFRDLVAIAERQVPPEKHVLK
jgi:hypothetical protein